MLAPATALMVHSLLDDRIVLPFSRDAYRVDRDYSTAEHNVI